MELKHHNGWVKVIQLLAEQVYDVAVIVIRPELLGQAIDAFPATVYTVVHVRENNRDALTDTLYRIAIQHNGNADGK